jgi:hypothetical protein
VEDSSQVQYLKLPDSGNFNFSKYIKFRLPQFPVYSIHLGFGFVKCSKSNSFKGLGKNPKKFFGIFLREDVHNFNPLGLALARYIQGEANPPRPFLGQLIGAIFNEPQLVGLPPPFRPIGLPQATWGTCGGIGFLTTWDLTIYQGLNSGWTRFTSI